MGAGHAIDDLERGKQMMSRSRFASGVLAALTLFGGLTIAGAGAASAAPPLNNDCGFTAPAPSKVVGAPELNFSATVNCLGTTRASSIAATLYREDKIVQTASNSSGSGAITLTVYGTGSCLVGSLHVYKTWATATDWSGGTSSKYGSQASYSC